MKLTPHPMDLTIPRDVSNPPPDIRLAHDIRGLGMPKGNNPGALHSEQCIEELLCRAISPALAVSEDAFAIQDSVNDYGFISLTQA